MKCVSHLQGLSRVEDGLLVTEVDLNLIQQIRDKWCFQVSVLIVMEFKKIVFGFASYYFEKFHP